MSAASLERRTLNPYPVEWRWYRYKFKTSL